VSAARVGRNVSQRRRSAGRKRDVFLDTAREAFELLYLAAKPFGAGAEGGPLRALALPWIFVYPVHRSSPIRAL